MTKDDNLKEEVIERALQWHTALRLGNFMDVNDAATKLASAVTALNVHRS